MTAVREPMTPVGQRSDTPLGRRSDAPLGRRSDLPLGESELDAHLTRLVRRTSIVRQGFYVVVLLVALAGQVSGAVETLHIPLAAAVPAVAALELGGIVVLANADVRRRLGERAIASRILSVAIAASAVAFNWLAHKNHLLGAFFAGMSALGYLVWLMHTENQRRDRLRVKGDLPPTTPAYEMIGHWLRHPMLTVRARAMAKADPRLGLYDSLFEARAEIRRERRQAAIAKVLHRKIRAAVDPKTADIAIAVYDLDEIAARLAERADYDGLTTLIAADLAPERLAPDGLSDRRSSGRAVDGGRGAHVRPDAGRPEPSRSGSERTGVARLAADRAAVAAAGEISDALAMAGTAGLMPERVNGARASSTAAGTEPRETRQARDSRSSAGVQPRPPADDSAPPADDSAPPADDSAPPVAAATRPRPPVRAALSPALRQDVERRLNRSRAPARRSGVETRASFSDEPPPEPIVTDVSLRRRVHAALDANVLPGDQRDDSELIGLVFDELNLNELERLTAATYVRSWRLENESGQRIRLS
jgi:hypothetical protein